MSNPSYTLEWLLEKQEKEEKLKFLFFWGHTQKNPDQIDKSCFSQWYQSPFKVEDIIYHTAEHWMMAQKAFLFSDQEIFEKIIEAQNPGKAKALGRSVTGFDQKIWNENRVEIVINGNLHKFQQNPQLKEYLIQTHPRILVEASPVDNIWGIGIAQDNEKIQEVSAWQGLNLLGFALMEVRDLLM